MAYIEREKAIDEIDKWLDSVGYETVGKGLTSYGELIGCLKDTPTADVVDVVRCKDCLYATERYGHLNCIHGVSYRNSWNKPDEYCSHGVRKD